jgi:hypothetical protein
MMTIRKRRRKKEIRRKIKNVQQSKNHHVRRAVPQNLVVQKERINLVIKTFQSVVYDAFF